jgi:hypothetical protein
MLGAHALRRGQSQDRGLEALAVAGVALTAYAATAWIGVSGLLAPLGLVCALVLIGRPVACMSVFVSLVVLCEGPTFGLLRVGTHLYDELAGPFTLLDALFGVVLVSIALDVLRHGASTSAMRPLILPLGLVVLAMAAGAVTGHAGGQGVPGLLSGLHALAYLVAVPLAVAALRLDRRRLLMVLGAAAGLAVLKAVVGLVAVAGGRGLDIDGSTLTYYEPTANWLVLTVALAAVAAMVLRARPPRWLLLGAPLLAASLVLSYRRSFWIGAAVAIVLVILIGASPAGRRLVILAALPVIGGIVLLGSVAFQSQSRSTLVERVQTLTPSRLESQREDRYRIDERVNVMAEIRRRPLTGLGVSVPWSATARPLPTEHDSGRLYVHMAFLWWWLKLGVLGAIAYLTVLVTAGRLAWRTFRADSDARVRAVGLASLAALVALAVMETTASFTGVDLRFTILLGAQLGLLAVAADHARDAPPPTIGDQGLAPSARTTSRV